MSPPGRNSVGYGLFLPLMLVVSALARTTVVHAEGPLVITHNLIELNTCRKAVSRLSAPMAIQYDRYPLPEALLETLTAAEVPIWLDRRVDRSRLVSILQRGKSTRFTCVSDLAKAGGFEAGLIESVIYVGPADQVSAVQRSAIRLHQQWTGLAKPNQAAGKTLEWEDLTTPEELLVKIEKLWDIDVEGTLPHDLMRAGRLESTSLATQLTLLMSGFDLQVRCESANRLVTEPLEKNPNWTATYSKKELIEEPPQTLAEEYEGAKIESKGGSTRVTGPTDLHLRLLKPLTTGPEKSRPSKESNSKTNKSGRGSAKSNDPLMRTFTLPKPFTAPLENVLNQLAKNFSIEVQWADSIAQVKRQKVTTLDVPTPKTLDEVLESIAQTSGFSIRREGKTIRVDPK